MKGFERKRMKGLDLEEGFLREISNLFFSILLIKIKIDRHT
jgi:hypothetical protein